MRILALSRPAVLVGGVALAWTAATGIAAADPDFGPAVTTTCSYSQVLAAMNAQAPATAAQFNATPAAQTFLVNFLAAPPLQRQQMLVQAQSTPEGAQFVGIVEPVANTCHDF